jgi:Protein of unknown function (DUF3237)
MIGPLVSLKLEHAFDLHISFGDELRLGATSLAHTRAFHPVTGGSVWGPRLKGAIVAGSGSEALCLGEARIVVGGQWLIRAADGSLILMKNAGFAPGMPIDPWRADTPEFSSPSLHLAPVIEAPGGPHAWLNRTVFVGKGDRRRTNATVRIFAVM